LRFFKRRLVARQLPFGGIEPRLINVALDAEELRSLRDRGGSVLPVRLRYKVTGFCRGGATTTLGGGGGT
jgi:hypothetical protein